MALPSTSNPAGGAVQRGLASTVKALAWTTQIVKAMDFTSATWTALTGISWWIALETNSQFFVPSTWYPLSEYPNNTEAMVRRQSFYLKLFYEVVELNPNCALCQLVKPEEKRLIVCSSLQGFLQFWLLLPSCLRPKRPVRGKCHWVQNFWRLPSRF